MWIRVKCPACGVLNLLPEKRPGHVELCVECDKPIPDPCGESSSKPSVVAPLQMPSPFTAKAPRKETGKAGLFVALSFMTFLLFGGGVVFGVFVVAPGWREQPGPGPQIARPETPETEPTPTAVSPSPEPPENNISWLTFQDDRGGFRIEYPERIAAPMSALPAIEKDRGRVHGVGPGGVAWDIRYEGYFTNFTETQLLYWAGLDSRGKESLTRKDIRFGSHPGFEHITFGTPEEDLRLVRSRIFAAGNRIYEVSVLADPKATGPAGWEDRFLDSFRLLAEPNGNFAEVLSKDQQTIWRESWSVPGNYSVAMPGRATEWKTKSPGSDLEWDVTSRSVDGKGKEFLVRSLFHAGPLTGAALLEEVGVKELAKLAVEKRAVKFGNYLGIEFTASKTTDGRLRAVRSKIIAVGNRLLQLSVTSESPEKTPDAVIARFFDSFRLANDPAVAGKDPFVVTTGGWLTYKNAEWNFSANFPGGLHFSSPKQALDNSAAWEARSVLDLSGASFVVTAIRYREDLAGGELLEQMWAKRLTTPATKKTPIKLGVHPGMEFHTQTAGKGPPTDRRIRMFAVGGWLYELSIDVPGGKIPEELAARFFDSFRLLDPAGRPTPGEVSMKK
ncbi:hypothetical protein [Zavarzinella formosa]|uniref:hypothetical protein n=1 Tax=Zavarzinella formosa TaxID=360055 RepID=UPI0002DDDC97|nr:hypothetical protein [Zavarzinella formosa]